MLFCIFDIALTKCTCFKDSVDGNGDDDDDDIGVENDDDDGYGGIILERMTLPRSLSLRSFQGEILNKIQSLENKDKKVFVPQWHFRFIILLVETAPST